MREDLMVQNYLGILYDQQYYTYANISTITVIQIDILIQLLPRSFKTEKQEQHIIKLAVSFE